MASALSAYLSANVLLLVAGVLWVGMQGALTQSGWRLSPGGQLQGLYGMLALCLVLPWVPFPADSTLLLTSAAQPEAAGMRSLAGGPGGPALMPMVGLEAGVPVGMLGQLMLACGVGGLGVALWRLGMAWSAARGVLGRACLLRRCGTLRIFASEEIRVPFSFWMPGCHAIVVPMELLTRPADLHIALRHEAQHHRQGDTRMAYALTLLQGAFCINPAMHLLRRRMHELQELSCDAAVVASRQMSPQLYCECLLRIAESALARPAQTAWMHMAARDASLLARRVRALLPGGPRSVPPLAGRAVFLGMLAALTMTGVALPGTMHDHPLTMAQAQELAAHARAQSRFPIVLNAQVLEQLHVFTGTQGGRALLREGLQRLHQQERVVARELEQRQLPREMLALPLIESGYQNRMQDANPMHGAGIWMMIPHTARAMGLTVEGRRDERLDVIRESQAAARLLSEHYEAYKDWKLVLLAYNTGRGYLDKAIRTHQTRDAFELSGHRTGHERIYLARAMAVIILLANERQLSME